MYIAKQIPISCPVHFEGAAKTFITIPGYPAI
jgi:hypothetical protein